MADALPDPLNGLAALLNEAFNIGAQISDGGALHLRMDDDIAVTITTSPDQADMVFCSVLADLTRGRAVVTLVTAMSLNLYQQDTRGGALALDPASQTVVFCWRVPVKSVASTDWIIALENFCATAVSLRSSLDEAVGEFSAEELREVDQRAAEEPGLSESGTLAALERVAASAINYMRV